VSCVHTAINYYFVAGYNSDTTDTSLDGLANSPHAAAALSIDGTDRQMDGRSTVT